MNRTHVKAYIDLCKTHDYELIENILSDAKMDNTESIANKYNISIDQVDGLLSIAEHPYLLDETAALSNLEYIYNKCQRRKVLNSDSSEGGGGFGGLLAKGLKGLAAAKSGGIAGKLGNMVKASGATGKLSGMLKKSSGKMGAMGAMVDKGTALLSDPNALEGSIKESLCDCNGKIKIIKDAVRTLPMPEETRAELLRVISSAKTPNLVKKALSPLKTKKQRGGDLSDEYTTYSSSIELSPSKMEELNEYR